MAANLAIIISAKDAASGIVKGIGDEVAGLGGKVAATGKIIAAGFAVGATAMLGLGAAAFKLGGDFDSAYDAIRIGTGATGDALQALQADFKAVVKDVPTDFGTASQVLADLNTRTGQTGQGLQELSKNILEMSRITKTDAVANVALATRVFGDWGVETEKQTGTLDMLFRASQATGIGLADLQGKVVQFGAPLRAMGFSLGESATMLGKWEKEGVNTELVLGSMRIAMGNFANDNVPMRKGLEDTMAKIQALGPGAKATSLAMATFGARAGPDMAAAILEGRFALGELLAQIEGGSETILGAAADTADLAEKWTKLQNRLTVAAEPVASAVFSFAGSLLDNAIPALEGAIGSIEPFFQSLLHAADGLRLLVTSSPDVQIFGSNLKAMFGLDITPFTNALAAAQKPLADLVHAGEGLLLIATSSGSFETFASNIKGMFGVDISGFVGPVESARVALDAIGAAVGDITGKLGKGDFAGAWDELQKAMNAFAPTGERITAVFKLLKDAISAFVPQPLKDFVSGLFDSAAASTDGWEPMVLLADAVNAVSGAVENAVRFLRDHQEVQAVLTGLVAAGATAYILATAAAVAHGAATKAMAIATGIMTAAQTALNVVMSANPIGLVVIALVGLATTLLYVWNTNEGFRTALTAAWEAIRTIGELMFKAVGDAMGKMGQTIGQTWEDIKSSTKSAINAVIGFLNNLISAWNALEFKIPGFDIELPSAEVAGQKIGGGKLGWGGITIGTPDLPMIPVLDAGAVVRRPTLAMLAMNRVPEAVVPLESAGRRMGAVNIYITVQGSVVTERDLAARVRDSLLALGRQNLSVGLA